MSIISKKLTIGMLAHVDAGKTTLSEALLYKTGTIRKIGRVDNKDAFFDSNYLERARGITIFSKQAVLNIGDYSVTLLDTPGHVDFSAEMERTLSVLDYAILVISGSDGVQSHTDTLWRLLARYKIPTFIFVNKMDQPDNKADRILEHLKNKLSSNICNYTYPDFEDIALCDENLLENYLENGSFELTETAELIKKRKVFPCFFGSALKLTGIEEFIEKIQMLMQPQQYEDTFGARVFKISRDNNGARLTHLKITGGELLSKQTFTENEKINQIRVYSGDKYTTINTATAGSICAVTGIETSQAGASYGADIPSQIPMLEPVLTYKLNLPESTDTLVMLPKLKELEDESPELHVVYNEFLKEIQLQVMGAVQIEVLQKLIEDRFNIPVTFGTGKIVYKETITNTVEGVGHFEPLRHYAEVHLLLEPLPAGSGMQYTADCNEDKLDKNWQRLVMTHLYEKAQTGVIINAPLTDVKITLVAGRAHNKHTEGGDFRQATYRAIRQGLMQAESIILEPVYSFSLEIPTANVGRAMTDLEQMHAVFELGSLDSSHNNINPDFTLITGEVPVATFGDYQTTLISYTKGLGRINLVMAGYKPCHNQDEVINDIAYDANADTLNPSASVFCSHGSGVIVQWNEVFEHMHVESVLEARRKGIHDEDSLRVLNPKESSRTVSDIPMGTDEIDAILKQTYYSNSKDKSDRKYMSASKKSSSAITRTYKGTEPSINDTSRKSYLLVDGYNIIHAWDELKELALDNLDGARGRLLDILCNYQAMKNGELIVVFDAYRVKGHDTAHYDYNNIHVVFTKEAETADQYIEKFAHENGKKYNIRVATSDGLEQIIIIGQGCQLVSAREFQKEVKDIEERIRDEFLNKSY